MNSKKMQYQIHGMHCANCEVLIERQLKKIPGVVGVHVNRASGQAAIDCSREPGMGEMQKMLSPHGYTISALGAPAPTVQKSGRRYAEIGGAFVLVFALYLLAKQFNLIPSGFGVSEEMGLGMVFAIGLVAAVSSCMAVTGGLLLAIAAKHNERHPDASSWQKFRPHLYFNVGRVASYTLLGGAVGALGSMLTISPRATGVLTVLVSLVMVLLGLQLLHLFPGLQRLQPRMPKFIAHRVHDMSGSEHRAGPVLLGAATFFLPCGFTQALQLYVLSQGNAVRGALTMLVFSLGTLPALLSVGAISSFARGSFQRYFLKFAGALVILLGIGNINRGLTLAGVPLSFGGFSASPTAAANDAVKDENVLLENGVQVVEMKVTGYEYSPSRFTVRQGVPVEWRIDGTGAAGCAQVITMPKLNITEYLPRDGVKTIRFTPENTGTLPFSCTMGMTTPGAAFTVVANTDTTSALTAPSGGDTILGAKCDPQIANCLSTQRLQMSITRERGFSPNTFTVKVGQPVELEIDTQVPLSGCMSTLVIPEYNVAHRLSLGKTTLRFTPTNTGVVPFTCSMGSWQGQFTVVE
ncbi:MAG: sulfite exporter TauE/SafE family protein [Patescibacteria group bacterium]|nr:sulfite exporter TauE/SafE family protein [Patescibacteria group bacterium]